MSKCLEKLNQLIEYKVVLRPRVLGLSHPCGVPKESQLERGPEVSHDGPKKPKNEIGQGGTPSMLARV